VAWRCWWWGFLGCADGGRTTSRKAATAAQRPHLGADLLYRPGRANPHPDPGRLPGDGRARLSYRRAADLFTAATRPLSEGDGWVLHQLRHSALTHEAEDDTKYPLVLARSRHASVRSLERYARPGPQAVARHVAGREPAARHPPRR
jgi:integrase/recombinase XerD